MQTLKQISDIMKSPDHSGGVGGLEDAEVVFHTSSRLGLCLLSCYYGADDKVHIDIGETNE